MVMKGGVANFVSQYLEESSNTFEKAAAFSRGPRRFAALPLRGSAASEMLVVGDSFVRRHDKHKRFCQTHNTIANPRLKHPIIKQTE